MGTITKTMSQPILEAYPGAERVKEFVPLGTDRPCYLSGAQIEDFNDKGYICPIDVYTPDEAEANRAYFDDLLAKALAKGWNSYGQAGWHIHCRGLHDFVTEERILGPVRDLLGPDLVCWTTHFFTKLPGDGKQVSWHQDASFWPLTPSKTVTAWLAFDDADRGNAAMQVIPGTHRLGQLPFIHSEEGENNVLDQSTVDIDSFAEPPVHLEMRAGQMSLHTDWLLHGSDANHSDRRRCGLTLRFTSPDVRNFTVPEGTGVIACGRDSSGYWQHQPRPAGEDIPDPPRPEDDWQRRSGWKRAWDDTRGR
ncbi:MAG: phytanoyl-CoA dioxygenase family protein [Caldilineaceae bacterium]|nr:phytanoyl-CoA dioxygenase family protein [Caldilineaceae bacterium]